MRHQNFTEIITQTIERTDFYEFDSFFIEKITGINMILYDNQEWKSLRYKAYQEFLKRMGQDTIAALQTIKKWFGIYEKSMPTREQIFRIGFVLHLSEKEVEEYLKIGIKETGIQIDDYREVLFAYGLHYGMTYQEVLDMIDDYQEGLPLNLKFVQHSQSHILWKEYSFRRHEEKQFFLQWMWKHAGEFIGYNQNTLEYLQELKREILHGVRAEAKKELELYLGQTSFLVWEKNLNLSEKRRKKTIPKYFFSKKVREDGKISEDLVWNIMELLRMTEVSDESNVGLLGELYAGLNNKYRNYKTNNKKDNKKKRVPMDLNLIKEKHLSEMQNISINKEKLIRLSILKTSKNGVTGELSCLGNGKAMGL